MPSYNKVILIGHLTRDPELRSTASNLSVCNCALAMNEKWRSQDGDEREVTTFVDFTIWGKRAKAFADYHSKGNLTRLEGRLRLDKWKDPEGNKRQKLYVVVDDWGFMPNPEPGQRRAQPHQRRREPEPAHQEGLEYDASIDDTPF